MATKLDEAKKWLRGFAWGPWTLSHVAAALALGGICCWGLLVLPKFLSGPGANASADPNASPSSADRPFRSGEKAPPIAKVSEPLKKDPSISTTPLAAASEARVLQLPLEAARIESMVEGEEKDEAIAALMEEWAAANPAEAGAWVAGLPLGVLKETAAEELARHWAMSDIEASKQWISRQLGTGQLQGAVGVFVNEWSLRAPADAAKWIESLTFPGDRLAAVASLAQTWPAVDAAAAALWLTGLPREEQQAHLPNFLMGWSESDPAAAAQWFASRIAEDETISPDAASALVAQWTSRDAGEVSRWLNSLPDGPLYEVASAIFAEASAAKNPSSALSWAKAINEAPRRSHAVASIFQNWLEDDEAACLSALPAELDAMDDPALRRAVYDVLVQHDPKFKEQVLSLIEAPAPEAAAPAAPPVEEDPLDPFAIP